MLKHIQKSRRRIVTGTRVERYWQQEKMVYPIKHNYISCLAKHVEVLTSKIPQMRADLNCEYSIKQHEFQDNLVDPCKSARLYLTAFEENNAADEWSAFYGNLIQKSINPVLDLLKPLLADRDTAVFLDDIAEMVNESQMTLKALFEEELDLESEQYYIPCLMEYLYEWFRSSKREAVEDFYMMYEYSLELFLEECDRMYKRYVRQILFILEMIELTILTNEEKEVVLAAL